MGSTTIPIKGSRKDNRFDLRLPLQLTVEQDGALQYSISGSSLLNLSQRGAYVLAETKISKGRKVFMAFTWPVDYMDKYESDKLRVDLEGKVIRSEPSGFAVKLAETFRVSTVSS